MPPRARSVHAVDCGQHLKSKKHVNTQAAARSPTSQTALSAQNWGLASLVVTVVVAALFSNSSRNNSTIVVMLDSRRIKE